LRHATSHLKSFSTILFELVWHALNASIFTWTLVYNFLHFSKCSYFCECFGLVFFMILEPRLVVVLFEFPICIQKLFEMCLSRFFRNRDTQYRSPQIWLKTFMFPCYSVFSPLFCSFYPRITRPTGYIECVVSDTNMSIQLIWCDKCLSSIWTWRTFLWENKIFLKRLTFSTAIQAR